MAYGSNYNSQGVALAKLREQYEPLLMQQQKAYGTNRRALISAYNNRVSGLNKQYKNNVVQMQNNEANQTNSAFKSAIGRGVGPGLGQYAGEQIDKSFAPMYKELKINKNNAMGGMKSQLSDMLRGLSAQYGADQARVLADMAGVAQNMYSADKQFESNQLASMIDKMRIASIERMAGQDNQLEMLLAKMGLPLQQAQIENYQNQAQLGREQLQVNSMIDMLKNQGVLDIQNRELGLKERTADQEKQMAVYSLLNSLTPEEQIAKIQQLKQFGIIGNEYDQLLPQPVVGGDSSDGLYKLLKIIFTGSYPDSFYN